MYLLTAQIMDVSEFTVNTEGFTGIVRLAWVLIRSTSKQIREVNAIGSTVGDDEILRLCLNRACDNDLFGFLNTRVFETIAFQVFFDSLAQIPIQSCCKFILTTLLVRQDARDIVAGIHCGIRPILSSSFRFS